MDPKLFFQRPKNTAQRHYEALRAFFVEGKKAEEVADSFGYTKAAIYSLTRDFRNFLKKSGTLAKRFFVELHPGPKFIKNKDDIDNFIIVLRKKYLSVSDIKSILDSQNQNVSETYIYKVIKREGFGRLPRRGKLAKKETISNISVSAPKSTLYKETSESFSTPSIGILCFIPYILRYGIDRLIKKSQYPETKSIPVLNSILSFLALKLSNIRRYSADDVWCVDRGLGLFAGLNVLPKTAWFSSYSHRVTREMNLHFLRSLHKIWHKNHLLSNTANVDFVAVPYWGDDAHLENHWSGTRHQALPSILAALAHDPDKGIITYGDTDIRHKNKDKVVIEFLDFYRESSDLKYVVFDSKFTTYENLRKLDSNNVKFITIRRRGKKIVDELESLPKEEWKKIRVAAAGGKTRQLQIIDKKIVLRDYGKELRQIAITGHGKIKPALIITNDFALKSEEVVRKYARRWLVEKTISEQTHFFHLNRVSSSMVIKVDFDLTMTILAHNLYRLFAANLEGYEHQSDIKIYEKFVLNSGTIKLNELEIKAIMRKKRHHPTLISAMQQYKGIQISWLCNRRLEMKIASHS
jgi:DNA-binding transcriptional MerR regulator